VIRLAVLISGYGSNLQAIIDAIEDGRLPGAAVAVVVSDRAAAYGLERARHHGIPALHFRYPPRREGDTARRAQDARLAGLLHEYGVEWVVLAGWLRVLSNDFLRRFPMRVINLHPALPGQFPGLNAIERALQAYREGSLHETGVMVHFVPDETVDAGPVIVQRPVPILPTDDLESLAARVHAAEHELLIEALAHVLRRGSQAGGLTGSLDRGRKT
jgi:formyltetrahydrofolate-dependent phosphoribosylglycinamide formyltransferase